MERWDKILPAPVERKQEEASSKNTKIPEKGSTCAAIRAVFSGFRGWLTGTERNHQCAAPYTCHPEKAKHRCQSEDSATGKTVNSPTSTARVHTVSDLTRAMKKENKGVFSGSLPSIILFKK